MNTLLATVIIVIAVITLAVLAALIYAVGQRRQSDSPRGSEQTPVPTARWYQVLLAALLLVALLALAGYVFFWGLSSSSEIADNWRSESKTSLLLLLLTLGCGLAVLAFLIALYIRLTAPTASDSATSVHPNTLSPPDPQRASDSDLAPPSSLRLLGLLVVLVALLLLGILYLPAEQRYHFSLQLLYPASFAVALVLLFDKASRAWNLKSATANYREWLYCDLLALLLVLGYFNVMRNASAETYGGFFWDTVHLSAFFVVFWLLDRKLTRYRFLVAHGYLLLMPWLHQLWHASLITVEAEAASTATATTDLAGASWWHSAWPLFSLGLVFFLLEIIALLASKEAEKKALVALKDTLFIALYVMFMIAARPTPA